MYYLIHICGYACALCMCMFLIVGQMAEQLNTSEIADYCRNSLTKLENGSRLACLRSRGPAELCR